MIITSLKKEHTMVHQLNYVSDKLVIWLQISETSEYTIFCIIYNVKFGYNIYTCIYIYTL